MLIKLFLSLHFILWTLVGLMRRSIAMDTAEAIVWGGEWTFGTNKHPYLSGWVAELFYQLFGSLKLAAALMSATCTTLALCFTYCLARRFLDRQRALLASLVLEGVVYYSACSLEYNCNVLSVTLVPLFLWMIYCAFEENRLHYWIVAGFSAGALLMTKYTNGIIIAGVGMYALVYRRMIFRQFGFYFATIIVLLMVIPHVVYLIKTDFMPLIYLSGRSAVESASWYGHIVFPLKFLASQVFAIWGVIVVIAFLALQGEKASLRQVPQFIWFAWVVPIIILAIISLVFGMRLKSMWGYAFMGGAGIFAFTMMGRISDVRSKNVLGMIFIMLIVQAVGMGIVSLVHVSSRSSLDTEDLIAALPVEDVSFVGGDIWLASEIALNLPQRARVVIDMDNSVCPWIDADEVRARGVLAITDNFGAIKGYRERFPELETFKKLDITLKSYLGSKTKTKTIYYSKMQ